ncbi:MAG TPA: DUF92 domain-containing protein [Chitinophaga sp.]|nr:DUF92 domain-containing protein [Chitinophaga sp.]
MPQLSSIIILVLLAAFMLLCVKKGKLTPAGGLAAGVTGLLVFAGSGITGVMLLTVFFLLATIATSHKKKLKATVNPHPEKRNAGQVFANGGVAAIMAALSLADPAHSNVYVLMIAASLASATADTVSSELGMVYGRNFYNILTFKRDTKGLDGVVSLEGTLTGAAGALTIAIVYSIGHGFDERLIYILAAGVLGNLIDSVLGASLERKRYINNDIVNFLNTLFAALIALLLFYR